MGLLAGWDPFATHMPLLRSCRLSVSSLVWCNHHAFTITRADQERTLTPCPEERENRPPRFRQSRAPRLVAARDAVFPLPAGEGQGEGEGALQRSGTRRFALRGALSSFA